MSIKQSLAAGGGSAMNQHKPLCGRVVHRGGSGETELATQVLLSQPPEIGRRGPLTVVHDSRAIGKGNA